MSLNYIHLDQFQLMQCYHFSILFIYLLIKFIKVHYLFYPRSSQSFWKPFDLNIEIYSQIYIVPLSPQQVLFSPRNILFSNSVCLRSKSTFFLKILFIYSWETQRDRGRGRSRLPAGNLIWNSIPGLRITPWAKSRCSTAEPPRHPQNQHF